MDQQHRQGQVGKVEEDQKAELHQQHGNPQPGAQLAQQRQWRKQQFDQQHAPGQRLQTDRRQREQRCAQRMITRERILQHQRDGVARQPTRAQQLGVSRIAVAQGQHHPRSQVQMSRQAPVGIRAATQARRQRTVGPRRHEGMQQQHPAEQRQARVGDQRIALEQPRQDQCGDQGTGAIEITDRQRRAAKRADGEQHLDHQRGIVPRQRIGQHADVRAQFGAGEHATGGKHFAGIGEQHQKVHAQEDAERDSIHAVLATAPGISVHSRAPSCRSVPAAACAPVRYARANESRRAGSSTACAGWPADRMHGA